MVYFDNAATTGVKPKEVIDAVNLGLKKYSANPGRSGHSLSQNAALAVYNTRQKLADFFGADGAENVVFTLNCTHALNYVIKGVLRRGDHVVTSNLEHNAVMRPLTKTGVNYSTFNVDFFDENKTVLDFKSKLRPNTKLVVCTAASNVWGKILPIEEIGEICKAKGVLFCVDAAQGAGVLPINMGKMNIDFLCVAPHKGLYAPMGIGVLICRKPIENTLLEGGSGTNSIELFQPKELPERLECGTVNVPEILGVSGGVDYINKLGFDKIYKHELSLINRLYSGLKKVKDIRLYTPFPSMYEFVPVLSFNYKDFNSEKTAEILSKLGFAVRGGLHCSPQAHKALNTLETGAVRVSVATFNTNAEIDKFLECFYSKKVEKI